MLENHTTLCSMQPSFKFLLISQNDNLLVSRRLIHSPFWQVSFQVSVPFSSFFLSPFCDTYNFCMSCWLEWILTVVLVWCSPFLQEDHEQGHPLYAKKNLLARHQQWQSDGVQYKHQHLQHQHHSQNTANLLSLLEATV